MRSQKGITLMSLIIYIIVLTIIMSILSTVSQMFFRNINYIAERGKYMSEFNKFNMYFIEDIKNNKQILELENTKVILADGTIYTFSDNGIYRNKVKICDNISACKFESSQKESGGITKDIVTVTMTIKGSYSLVTKNEYVLRYW